VEAIDNIKKTNHQMKSPINHPAREDAFNIGVRLYQKGIKQQEEKQRICK
jgi:hypothetical protein